MNSLDRTTIESLGVTAFSAPVGPATMGRLQFIRGVANVIIHPDDLGEDLFHAQFEGTAPQVEAERGCVSVAYRRGFHPFESHKQRGEVTLNRSLPWHVEIRSGAAHIVADLAELQLRSVDVKGGAHDVKLTLPRPGGEVPVRLAGGATSVLIRRPDGIAVRVQVHKGATHLQLDGQSFDAIGGGFHWESPGFGNTEDRYDLTIEGGASQITLESV